MPEIRTVRLLSIPLAKFEAKSGSHVLSFFTQDRGQIRSMVRRSEGKKKPSSPVLPLFSTYECLFREPTQPEGLYELKERETVHGRGKLNSGAPLEPWAAASVLSELLLKTTENEDPHPYLFQMLDKALDRLEGGQDPWILMTAFLVKFLEHMGYRPRWEAPEGKGSLIFDPAVGGLCNHEEWERSHERRLSGEIASPVPVSPGEIHAIQDLRARKFEALPEDPGLAAAARKWMPVLGDYVKYHLEVGLKSLEFWSEIQPRKKS